MGKLIVMFVKKSGETAIENVENGSKLLLECWKNWTNCSWKCWKSRKKCSRKCCTRVRAWLRSTIICLRGRVCPSFLPLFCLCSLFISNIRYKVWKEKKRGILTLWDKKFRNEGIAQPILLILNQQKTDVIRNRISIQMALR